jgi:hypothetical protein
MQERYEEQSKIGQIRAWIYILFFSAALMSFGMAVHMIIMDAPRHWDFGTLPDAPGESIYSSARPNVSYIPPLQLEPLPKEPASEGVQ